MIHEPHEAQGPLRRTLLRAGKVALAAGFSFGKFLLFLYVATLLVHILIYDTTATPDPRLLAAPCGEEPQALLLRYIDYDLDQIRHRRWKRLRPISEAQLCLSEQACNNPERSKFSRILCEHHAWIRSGIDLGIGSDDSPLRRFLTTFTIAAAAFLLSYVFSLGVSLALTFLSWLRPYRETIKTVIFIPSLIPIFLIAPFFKEHFAGHLGESSYRPMAALVALAVGNGIVAEFVRMLTFALEKDLQSNFIRMALAKGLPFWPRGGRWKESVAYHLMRSTLVTTLPLLSTKAPYFVGGAIVVELSVNINGIGKTFVYGLRNGDANDILVGIVLSALLVSLYTAAFRGIERLLDPRIEGMQR